MPRFRPWRGAFVVKPADVPEPMTATCAAVPFETFIATEPFQSLPPPPEVDNTRVSNDSPRVRSTQRQMVARGLLERTGVGGVTLGARLYELGHLVLRQRTLLDTALPLLGNLFESTRSAVNLAILDDDQILYLAKLTSTYSPQVDSRVGGRLPAYCTAVGKAILAYSPTEIANSVASRPLPRRTPYTIANRARLIREFGRIQESGVAYDVEESAKGTLGIAAPVLHKRGLAVAALSVTSWSYRPAARRLTAEVQTTARALSRQLYGGSQSNCFVSR